MKPAVWYLCMLLIGFLYMYVYLVNYVRGAEISSLSAKSPLLLDGGLLGEPIVAGLAGRIDLTPSESSQSSQQSSKNAGGKAARILPGTIQDRQFSSTGDFASFPR